MSNTEQMVSVPLSALEKCLRDAQIIRFTCDKHVLHLQDLLAQPAEQHQGEPVGEVVAFGKGLHEIAWAAGRMPKLGAKLYTSADPTEVERLRDENRRLHEAGEFLDGVNQGIEDKLRAQLAEAHALLREAACHATRMEPMSASCLNRIDAALDAALSASAEPSAPVEIDERKPFEEWCASIGYSLKATTGGNGYLGGYGSEMFSAWQARAALERKP